MAGVTVILCLLVCMNDTDTSRESYPLKMYRQGNSSIFPFLPPNFVMVGGQLGMGICIYIYNTKQSNGLSSNDSNFLFIPTPS